MNRYYDDWAYNTQPRWSFLPKPPTSDRDAALKVLRDIAEDKQVFLGDRIEAAKQILAFTTI